MQSIQSPEREFQGFFSITGKRVPVILFQARRWDNLCTRHQKKSVRTKTSKLLWCSRWTRSLLWQLSLLELSMLRLNKSLCLPSVFSQCALSVCPTSVSYQCVFPGGAGSGPQPAASPQCVLRILCIRWYAELHVPSAALIYGCSCKSAAALLVERSHGEGSFARIFNARLATGLSKLNKRFVLYYFGSGRHSVEDWAHGRRF